MIGIILRFLLTVCDGLLVCGVVVAGILYSAWIMSRRDNGWDR